MEEAQNPPAAPPPAECPSKRGRPMDDEGSGELSLLNEINGDILDKILSRLPPSSFFRLRSVCRRWRSASSSATFLSSCSEVPSRDPWFFMVDSHLLHSVVFDAGELNWKILNLSSLPPNSIPVAAAGGLVCFRSPAGDLSVCNPVTGSARHLPSPTPVAGADLQLYAIAMKTSSPSYQLVLISGDSANLAVNVYNSEKSRWEKSSLSMKKLSQYEADAPGEETVYFLSKSGEVVAADTQRSPFKKYSSVMTAESDEVFIYFLGSTGAIVACNLTQFTMAELPRLLPLQMEYSIDVVVCMGEMMAVVLWEMFEAASLRIWRFCRREHSWRQAAAMPPAMCRDWYGKRADINCTGFREMILLCLSSSDLCRCVICNVAAGEWRELPAFSAGGVSASPLSFMSAFSFEPRLEARV